MSDLKTILPNARLQPRFAGVSTFCRFPTIEETDRYLSPIDWAIFGAPYDSGVTYRPGTRFGPRAVREESQYVKPYHIEHDIMLTEVFSMVDVGDAPVKPFNCEDNTQSVTDFAKAIAAPNHTKCFMVGGDHSNTLGNMRAAWERRGKPKGGLALIHFDSHVDTVDVTLGEKYSHASPFIRAVEEGILDPKRMLSVGVKGPLNTPDDLAYAKDNGVTLVTYEDWKYRDGQSRIDAFLADLGAQECYLTFDIDCVDPAYAPGTGTPSLGGFTSAEALHLLRTLPGPSGGAGPNIVGADVVEVLPDRDHAGITALLAAHVMFEIICLDALRQVRLGALD